MGFDVDPQTKNMMRGLIKMKNKHSLLLDPSAIFRPEHLMRHEAEETEEYGSKLIIFSSTDCKRLTKSRLGRAWKFRQYYSTRLQQA